jgi:hypothetical protein
LSGAHASFSGGEAVDGVFVRQALGLKEREAGFGFKMLKFHDFLQIMILFVGSHTHSEHRYCAPGALRVFS